jgi:hypothetical protein
MGPWVVWVWTLDPRTTQGPRLTQGKDRAENSDCLLGQLGLLGVMTRGPFSFLAFRVDYR